MPLLLCARCDSVTNTAITPLSWRTHWNETRTVNGHADISGVTDGCVLATEPDGTRGARAKRGCRFADASGFHQHNADDIIAQQPWLSSDQQRQ